MDLVAAQATGSIDDPWVPPELFHVQEDEASHPSGETSGFQESVASGLSDPFDRATAVARFYPRVGHTVLDAVLMLCAIPIALPVGFAIFLCNAILFRSLRDAFFVQDRVGRYGRVFRMVKFRTMTPVPEAIASWKRGGDVLRVTRFGRFLRNTHLDELPQFLNIVTGDMSFIGPRPEMVEIDRWARESVPKFNECTNPMRPGMTGLAQITQGYVGCDVDGYIEKYEINCRYERDVSLLLDLSIVLRTAVWMLRGRGWQSKPEVTNDASAAAPRGRIHEGLRLVLAALEEENIPYAILRGSNALNGAENEADVDLLLCERDVDRFERMLEAACGAVRARVHERARTGFLKQFYLHAETPSGRHEFLAVDVHTSECCFGVPFLTAEELLTPDNLISSELGMRLVDSLSAVVNVLGPFLSGGVIRTDYADRVVEVSRRDDGAIDRLACRLFGARLGERWVRALDVGSGVDRKLDPTPFRRALLGRAFRRRPFRSTHGAISFAYGARIRPLLRPRGRMLVFLGTDGSGKSTLAEAVARQLDDVYRGDRSGVIHLRPGVLPQINTIVHMGKTTYSLADMSRPHRARTSGRIGSNLRVAYYWLDYVIGYVLRVLPRRRRHSLVIFDRYFYDYLVDPMRSRIRQGTLAAKILSHLVPKPDHVFVCTTNAERVFERKQELPLPEVQRQLDAFEDLARTRGFEVIRTEQSVDACVDDVLDAMFRRAA